MTYNTKNYHVFAPMGRFQLESIYLNTLEEIEILKAASSKHLLNDVIAGQNDPIYINFSPHSDLNSKINSPGQATNKNSKF